MKLSAYPKNRTVTEPDRYMEIKNCLIKGLGLLNIKGGYGLLSRRATISLLLALLLSREN